MKRIVLPVLLLVCHATGARADLAADLRAALADRNLQNAQVGLIVAEAGAAADKARVLFEHNARMPLVPASNMKILTTTTAIERLGADFKFRTLLVQRGQDLVIVGDGDPSLGDAELLKAQGWGVTTVFERWAEALKQRGVKSVGNVLVDDSVFDEAYTHSNWDGRHLHKRYAPQVAGLNLNANAVDFHLAATQAGQPVRCTLVPPTAYVKVDNRCITARGNLVRLDRPTGKNEVVLSGTSPGTGESPVSIAVHDPAMYGATVLAETLSAAGIRVSGTVSRDRTVRPMLSQPRAQGLTVLAMHETPLSVVLGRANKDSMNVYAEALCKRVGFAVTGQSGTWSSGTSAMVATLRRLGIDAAEFRVDDGSGLSEQNLLSAAVLLRLLIHNHHAPHSAMFLSSLSVAGKDGTLKKRFAATDLHERVMAKTGYISGVSALSGFVRTRGDNWCAFSLLINRAPDGGQWKERLQEAILKAIDVHAAKPKP